MSMTIVRPVWRPTDTQALRELAAEFPTEVGASVALADLVESEGLT